MPKYVTVEEVPEFLSKTLLMDYRVGKAAGSETVSPLYLPHISFFNMLNDQVDLSLILLKCALRKDHPIKSSQAEALAGRLKGLLCYLGL